MFKNFWLNTRRRLAVLGIAAIILAILILIGGSYLRAQASQPAEPAATLGTYVCTPAHVAAYTAPGQGRIHVQCTVAATDGLNHNIWYFAYPTTDSSAASRYLSILSTAFATGNTVTVLWVSGDTSGNAFGCIPSNCRTLTGLSIP
jgi:hypothetical protein